MCLFITIMLDTRGCGSRDVDELNEVNYARSEMLAIDLCMIAHFFLRAQVDVPIFYFISRRSWST
jgi:hypothetical protein